MNKLKIGFSVVALNLASGSLMGMNNDGTFFLISSKYRNFQKLPNQDILFLKNLNLEYKKLILEKSQFATFEGLKMGLAPMKNEKDYKTKYGFAKNMLTEGMRNLLLLDLFTKREVNLINKLNIIENSKNSFEKKCNEFLNHFSEAYENLFKDGNKEFFSYFEMKIKTLSVE